MTIKQLGGVFGRNPTFNDVTIEGQLTFDGDIDVNSDLKVDGDLEVTGTSKLTGDVAVGLASASTALHVFSSSSLDHITIDGDAGDNRNLGFRTADSQRWNLYANGTAESGGNAGSDLSIARYTDAGGFLGAALGISRSTADITTYGNVVMQNGKGIDFSATAGTGTSELLDDYEEGTWIPAYTGASGSASYNVQSGTYTKVGREVTVIGELQASRNTLTGNITISGLPFASSGNGGGMLVTFAILFDSDMPNLRGYATSTSLSLRKQATNASGSTSVTASDLSIAAINHNYLYFSATYFTT